jgi:hypothetical protein
MIKISWYSTYKIAQIQGEWWIQDGSAIFADANIGDYSHEGYVMESIQTEYGMKDFEDWDEFKANKANEYLSDKNDKENIIENLTLTEIAKIAIKEEQESDFNEEAWDIAEGEGDARLFAMKNWGWQRMEGRNVETLYLRSIDLNNIADGIYDAYDEESMNSTFNIYVFSNNKWYTDVPYYAIESGISEVRQYIKF